MFKITLYLGLAATAAALLTPRPLARHNGGLVMSPRTGSVAVAMSDPLQNFFRSQRGVAAGDRLVEIKKPLGLILEEDDKGNVYVSSITPGGNAAKSKKVNPGDQVVMCSATFGDEMWSTRGSGLYSVMNAVKVRQGDSVRLILEGDGDKGKVEKTKRQIEQEKKDAVKAQARRDELLKELEATDDSLRAKKPFFGLF